MRYYDALHVLENKLEKLLDEEGLVFSLHAKSYPITLVVSRDVSPEAQMELFSNADSDTSSIGAKLQFIFKLDALEIRTDERFVIPDALMTKIKGLAKKIHHAFLEGFFAERIASNSATIPEPAEPVPVAPAEPDAFAEFLDDDNSPENTEGNE
jgi:hypothetical protein